MAESLTGKAFQYIYNLLQLTIMHNYFLLCFIKAFIKKRVINKWKRK